MSHKIARFQPCLALVVGLASVAPALLVAGCQSKTDRARSEVRESAASFRDTLETMPGQIESTVRSLETAVDARQTKPWEASGKFEEELRTMRRTERTLRDESERAIADAEKYFAEWERDTAHRGVSATTRDASLADRAAAQDRYALMRETLRQAADEYRKMVSAAERFKARLGPNVSAATMQGIREEFDQIMMPGIASKQKVEALLAQMSTNSD